MEEGHSPSTGEQGREGGRGGGLVMVVCVGIYRGNP